MKVRELKNYKDKLMKKIKEVDYYLDVIIDEKSRMFIRDRMTFMRDIVIFKQMLKVIKLEAQLIQNLENKMEKIEEISENQSHLVKKLVAKIVEYHENIILKYERSEEHTSELQSRGHLVCRLLLEKKKNIKNKK